MKLPFTSYAARLAALALLSLAVAGPLSAQATSPSPAAKGKKLFFVSNRKSKEIENDVLAEKELKTLGFDVTVGNHDDPASKADGSDLIVISSTVSAHVLWDRYRDVKIPIMTWEPFELEHLRMAGLSKDVDWGENEQDEQVVVWLVNAPHPMQAGLANGLSMPWSESVKVMSWGRPSPAAQIIATIPGDPHKALIFGYEKGAGMDYNFPAPARRSFFFLTNDTVKNLGPDGWKLFDAEALWTLGATGQ